MTIYEILKDFGVPGLVIGSVIWAIRKCFKAYRERPTRRQRELLVAATTGEQIILFNYPNLGKPWVRSGKLDLGNSPLTQAEYVDALDRLIALHYIHPVQNNLFTLSARGIKEAEDFAKKIRTSEIPCAKDKPSSTVGAYVW